MVLAHTKKRPTATHHKKRTGQHHKHSKHYTKTYWPYLPVVLIVAAGAAVNAFLGANHNELFGSVAHPGVSRIQALTGLQWSAFAIISVAAVCVLLYAIRHSVMWYRIIRGSEKFIAHHPILDASLAIIAVTGFILTRSAGL